MSELVYNERIGATNKNIKKKKWSGKREWVSSMIKIGLPIEFNHWMRNLIAISVFLQ